MELAHLRRESSSVYLFLVILWQFFLFIPNNI